MGMFTSNISLLIKDKPHLRYRFIHFMGIWTLILPSGSLLEANTSICQIFNHEITDCLRAQVSLQLNTGGSPACNQYNLKQVQSIHESSCPRNLTPQRQKKKNTRSTFTDTL